MDQAPIVVPRGFKGFWEAIIWARIGVGFGLLGDGSGLVRMKEGIEMDKEGIDRVCQEIEGV